MMSISLVTIVVLLISTRCCLCANTCSEELQKLATLSSLTMMDSTRTTGTVDSSYLLMCSSTCGFNMNWSINSASISDVGNITADISYTCNGAACSSNTLVDCHNPQGPLVSTLNLTIHTPGVYHLQCSTTAFGSSPPWSTSAINQQNFHSKTVHITISPEESQPSSPTDDYESLIECSPTMSQLPSEVVMATSTIDQPTVTTITDTIVSTITTTETVRAPAFTETVTIVTRVSAATTATAIMATPTVGASMQQFSDKISFLSHDPILVLVGLCVLVVAVVIIIISWIVIVILCCKRRKTYPMLALYSQKNGEITTAMHTHRPGYESVRVTSDSPSNTLSTESGSCDTLTRTEDEVVQQRLIITNAGYSEARRESKSQDH